MKEVIIDGLRFNESYIKELIINDRKEDLHYILRGVNIGLFFLQTIYITALILTMMLK